MVRPFCSGRSRRGSRSGAGRISELTGRRRACLASPDGPATGEPGRRREEGAAAGGGSSAAERDGSSGSAGAAPSERAPVGAAGSGDPASASARARVESLSDSLGGAGRFLAEWLSMAHCSSRLAREC